MIRVWFVALALALNGCAGSQPSAASGKRALSVRESFEPARVAPYALSVARSATSAANSSRFHQEVAHHARVFVLEVMAVVKV
jgi:hypothetical protein